MSIPTKVFNQRKLFNCLSLHFLNDNSHFKTKQNYTTSHPTRGQKVAQHFSN